MEKTAGKKHFTKWAYITLAAVIVIGAIIASALTVFARGTSELLLGADYGNDYVATQLEELVDQSGTVMEAYADVYAKTNVGQLSLGLEADDAFTSELAKLLEMEDMADLPSLAMMLNSQVDIGFSGMFDEQISMQMDGQWSVLQEPVMTAGLAFDQEQMLIALPELLDNVLSIPMDVLTMDLAAGAFTSEEWEQLATAYQALQPDLKAMVRAAAGELTMTLNKEAVLDVNGQQVDAHAIEIALDEASWSNALTAALKTLADDDAALERALAFFNTMATALDEEEISAEDWADGIDEMVVTLEDDAEVADDDGFGTLSLYVNAQNKVNGLSFVRADEELEMVFALVNGTGYEMRISIAGESVRFYGDLDIGAGKGTGTLRYAMDTAPGRPDMDILIGELTDITMTEYLGMRMPNFTLRADLAELLEVMDDSKLPDLLSDLKLTLTVQYDEQTAETTLVIAADEAASLTFRATGGLTTDPLSMPQYDAVTKLEFDEYGYLTEDPFSDMAENWALIQDKIAEIMGGEITLFSQIAGNGTEDAIDDLEYFASDGDTIDGLISTDETTGTLNDETEAVDPDDGTLRADATALEALEAAEEARAHAPAGDEPSAAVGARTIDSSNIALEHPIATITMADDQRIFLELYPEYAPESVNNFIALSNSGFYDGLTFHRIIEDFMIQGGDPLGTGAGGPGYGIKGEFAQNGVANDLSHTLGVISMARAAAMDSAGSQFFLMNTDSATFLDGSYAAFGRTIDSASNDVILAITGTPLSGETPLNPPVIKTIRVDTRGVTYAEPTKLAEQ